MSEQVRQEPVTRDQLNAIKSLCDLDWMGIVLMGLLCAGGIVGIIVSAVGEDQIGLVVSIVMVVLFGFGTKMFRTSLRFHKTIQTDLQERFNAQQAVAAEIKRKTHDSAI